MLKMTQNFNFWFRNIKSPETLLYIVQKCAPLRGWKKFINVEKIENFTVQKNIICSATGNLNPIFYIYWGE